MKHSKLGLPQITTHEANAHSNAEVAPSSNASTRSSSPESLDQIPSVPGSSPSSRASLGTPSNSAKSAKLEATTTQSTEIMYEGGESVGWGGTSIITSSMFESLSRAADRILSGPEEAYKPLTQEERDKVIEESLTRAAAMPPFSEVLKLEEEYWAAQNKLLGHDKTDISFDH